MVKKIVRFILRFKGRILQVIGGFVLVFLTALVVLSLPPVQNALVPWLNKQLSAALHTEVRITAVNIALPDRVVLQGVRILDEQKLVLLEADLLQIGMLQFRLSDWYSTSTKVRQLGARLVMLDNAKLNLYRRQRDGKMNIDFILGEADTSKPSGKLTLLHFPNIEVKNLDFNMVDSTRAPERLAATRHHLNYGNLDVDSLYLDAGFEIKGPGRISAIVHSLQLRERKSGLHLRHLHTDMELNAERPFAPTRSSIRRQPLDSIPFIELLDTQIEIDSTRLDFDLLAKNETLDAFFQDNVPKDYDFNFRRSQLEFETIDYFTPRDNDLHGVLRFGGRITGGPTQLRCKEFTAHYGRDTRLALNFRIDNYRKLHDMLLDVELNNCVVNPLELRAMLPQEDIPTEVVNMGNVGIKAKYLGFVRDFVVTGHFTTVHGDFDTDLKLRLPRGTKDLYYLGRLRTQNLNVDTILMVKATDRLNFEGQLEGRNLDFSRMAAKSQFQMGPSHIGGYQVDTMWGYANIDSQVVKGDIRLRDREGDFSGQVEADMRGKKPRYVAFGDVKNLDLKHYDVLQLPIKATSIFNIRLRGDSLDNLNGIVRVFNLELSNTETHQAHSISEVVVSSRSGARNLKNLKVDSDMLLFTLAGQFSYERGAQLISDLAREGQLFLQNDTAAIRKYYENKVPKLGRTNMSFGLQIKNINPVLSFFKQPIQIDAGTELSGHFIFGISDKLTCKLNSTGMHIDSMRANKIRMNLYLEKNSLANSLFGDAKLWVNSLEVNEKLRLKTIFFEPSVRNKLVDFKLALQQDTLGNRARLVGSADFREGLMRLHLNADSTRIILRDSTWRLDPDNLVAYGEKYLYVEYLRLSNADQSISVESDVTPKGNGIFSAAIRNFSLRTLSDFLNVREDLEGKLNLDMSIKELFGQPQLRFNGFIKRFKYAKLNYGDLYARSDWSNQQEKLYLKVNLVAKADTLLGLKGYYNTRDKRSPMDFQLDTHDLPLELLAPFTDGILYDLTGLCIINRLRVQGRLSAPIIKGAGFFREVSFGVSYFKTKFNFDGAIEFNQTNIHLPGLVIRDRYGKRARVDGYIYHLGFTRLQLDLEMHDFNNFLVMDTKPTDNELFYGRAVVRQGKVVVRGTLENPQINANITTGQGTLINLPISFYREQKRLPYVYFKGSKDSLSLHNQINVSGMYIKMEVEATPDAEMRIIFDEKTGEVMKGRGAGLITMNITPSGEFSMYGNYEITQGQYQFSLKNVVSKPFTVQPGGRLQWSGDPVDAEMDMAAVYRVAAARMPDTTIRGTRPVDVFLKLKGSLLKPDISFDIQFPNTAQETSILMQTLLRQIQNDPNEQTRQVFSLLVTNSFAPIGSFADNAASAGATSTVSELLANQLNNLLGKAFDDKLGVSVSGNNVSRLNVAISARLFNDRFIIERNGNLSNNNGQGVSLGNISVRYRLLPTARSTARNPSTLELQGFNRENIGWGNTVVSTNRGIGLFFRKEFDHFFGPRRRRDEPVPIDSSKIKIDVGRPGGIEFKKPSPPSQ